MGPKSKKQTVSLADFLADDTFGSWADEMDSLPTAPAPRTESSYTRRGGDFLSSVPDRAERDRMMGDRAGPSLSRYPPREELPLPTVPPFTAFVGNLAFDLAEPDVEEFFAPHKIVSIRIVRGPDDRPKGFGYVEFETLDGLKAALDRTGLQLLNRTVRVSVAEPPKERGPFEEDKADAASTWRRQGPLPAMDGPGPRGGLRDGPPRTGFGGGSGGGFDDMAVTDGVRAGFGSKFTPREPVGAGSSREGPRFGAPRRGLGEGADTPETPSPAEEASDWRSSGPRRHAAEPRRTLSRGASYSSINSSAADETRFQGERMGMGSKFAPAGPSPPQSPGGLAGKKGFGFDRRASTASSAVDEPSDWRAAPRKGVSGPAWKGSEKAGEAAPLQRKKLELKPRSTDSATASPLASPMPTPGASSRPNPFGEARPVDSTIDRERDVEERLRKGKEERAEKEKIRREEQLKAKEEDKKTREEEKKAKEEEKAKKTGSAWRKDGPPAAAPTSPATGGDAASSSEGANKEDEKKANEEEKAKKTGNAGRKDGPPASSSSARATEPPASAQGATTAPEQQAQQQQPPRPRPVSTGAWGAGRKPSGALVPNASANPSSPAPAANGTGEEKEENEEKEEKAVDKVTQDVEGVKVSE